MLGRAEASLAASHTGAGPVRSLPYSVSGARPDCGCKSRWYWIEHARGLGVPADAGSPIRRRPVMGKEKLATKDIAIAPSYAADLARSEPTTELLRELVAHLRQNRTLLREEWVVRISEARLLTAMTKEEIFNEATSVYDSYVAALETGTFEALQAYARNLSERIIPRGVETHEVVGIVLLLRDLLARPLFAKYHGDFDKLNRILDAYEPPPNRLANTVAPGFVPYGDRLIRLQREG